jgi:predicted transcriptional regulator
MRTNTGESREQNGRESNALLLTDPDADLPEWARTDVSISELDTETLRGLLSPGRREIISAIQEHDPASISVLADAVDRSYSPVYEDVQWFSNLGIVSLVNDGRSTTPVLRPDEIVVSVSLTPSKACVLV